MSKKTGGEFVKEMRERRAGITIEQLAEATGIEKETIKALEADRRVPSPSMIKPLSKALLCTQETIIHHFGLSDDPNYKPDYKFYKPNIF